MRVQHLWHCQDLSGCVQVNIFRPNLYNGCSNKRNLNLIKLEYNKIGLTVFRDAASDLSLLKNCSADVIKSLASLATDPDGFGDPAKWTALQVIFSQSMMYKTDKTFVS